MISIYPPDSEFPVYHPSEWYGDSWNPLNYGRPLDLDRPFFEQWNELMLTVPRLGIDIVNCENSDYCNYCGDNKNCYLDIAGEGNEDCYYNLFTKHSKNCVDCTFVYNSELCYEALNCYRCYNVRHSMYIEDSSDCFFSFDLKGCRNCLFCSNLRRKEYHLFNMALTKAEYENAVAKLRLTSHKGLTAAIERWKKEVIHNALHRDMFALNSENCFGSDIKSSKNCFHVFNISDCEDSKYLYDVMEAKDCYDLNYSLYKPELSCELISTLGLKYSAYNMASHYCSEIFYCDQCNNSSNLFGCIGLNRKQFCILNKEYSPGDYKQLKIKLIARMQKDGDWGEFFPASMSPFGYNETIAQEYFPLELMSAKKEGFSWRTRQEQPSPTASIAASSLPDDIREADSSVTRQVLTCNVTGKLFKIIESEFDLYKAQQIPLPRQAPESRHLARLAMRSPRKLREGNCGNCNKKIVTNYRIEAGIRIYCEACYHATLN